MMRTASATSTSSVLIWISAAVGGSYGAEIPVKSNHFDLLVKNMSMFPSLGIAYL